MTSRSHELRKASPQHKRAKDRRRSGRFLQLLRVIATVCFLSAASVSVLAFFRGYALEEPTWLVVWINLGIALLAFLIQWVVGFFRRRRRYAIPPAASML